MAYRRRHGVTKSSTFEEEVYYPLAPASLGVEDDRASSSLAAQAIRASAAHRESSLSSAYGGGNGSGFSYRDRENGTLKSKNFSAYGDNLTNNDPKSGFGGILARKAKAIIEDEEASQHSSRMKPPTDVFYQINYQRSENSERMDNPTLRKGLGKITSSLNQNGDTFAKAFEEGRAKTHDIIKETQKLQIRRKGTGPDEYVQPGVNNLWQQRGQPQSQINHETQLKASRDMECMRKGISKRRDLYDMSVCSSNK